MTTANPKVSDLLRASRSTWLVTGAAGFIGSNLVEALLLGDQQVVGFDNFATGHQRNLDELRRIAPDKFHGNFRMITGDIRDREACKAAMEGVNYVLHQAALGSVPRSVVDPLECHDVNVTGFMNILEAAREHGAKRLVYAASSATYGDEPTLPKREDRIGQPLSPYGASKLANEIAAAAYANTYGFTSVGLRYFNVFGPRQDPSGAYAAVIPKWTAAMIGGEEVTINGDGETSRDFCYVANAVQANLLAAASDPSVHGVYNVALGKRTTLLELFELIRHELAQHQVHYSRPPRMADYRTGDIKHSQADITKAREVLNYHPTHNLAEGLHGAMPWYLEFFDRLR